MFKEKDDDKQEAFSNEALPLMDMLYNSALKLTNNADDAKDLVQDTYLSAYRFFDKYELCTSIHGWLYRIMKNIFINNYRKKKKQPILVDYSEVEPFIESIRLNSELTPGDSTKIIKNSPSDETIEAISVLREEFRTVLTLSDIEEFSYKEIAAILEIPIGTVRSRLARARKAVSNRLSKKIKAKSCIIENNAA